MKISSRDDPQLLREEALECQRLSAEASFTGVTAMLTERAETLLALADRIVKARQRLTGQKTTLSPW